MEIYEMGVRDLVQTWLAYKELNRRRLAKLDFSPSGDVAAATKAGWFDNIGFFGSRQKIIHKKIHSSPHHFWQAYGWFNADIYCEGNVVMPENLVAILAAKRHTTPALLFSEAEVATAIGHMCCDKGTDALRQGEYPNAVKWLRFAADQGNGHAQLTLGRLHSEGKGAPQDRVLAHKWFNLAAACLTGGSRDEAVTLRDKTSKGLTPDQRAEAEALARQWRQQSWDEIKAGDPSVDD